MIIIIIIIIFLILTLYFEKEQFVPDIIHKTLKPPPNNLKDSKFIFCKVS